MFNLWNPRIVTPNPRTHISSRNITKRCKRSLSLLPSLETPSRFEFQPSRTTTSREKSLASPWLAVRDLQGKGKRKFASWLMKKRGNKKKKKRSWDLREIYEVCGGWGEKMERVLGEGGCRELERMVREGVVFFESCLKRVWVFRWY